MTRRDKLLERMRNNPNNVRFEDLDKLFGWYGFECRQPKGGGSHYINRLGLSAAFRSVAQAA